MNKDYQKVLDEMLMTIEKEGKTPKLLLHACCAPCSSYVLEYLSKYFEITLYYYNPNIEPHDEFEKRSDELKRLITEMPLQNKVEIVVENYDNKEFKEAIKGFEKEKEGSQRCFNCYQLRMAKAASYAKENNFDYFTTTLSISPYKNCNKINEIGEVLEKQHEVKYLYADFKKKNGYKRSIELSKEYKLYRQDYCGCIYSKIEAEERRKAKEVRNGIEAIMSSKKKNKNTDFKVKKSDYNRHFSMMKVVLVVILFVSILYIVKNDSLISFFKVENTDTTTDNLIKIAKEELEINQEKIAALNELYFYGNHFNIKGTIELDNTIVDKASLVLVGPTYQYSFKLDYAINSTGISFYASKLLNAGLNFDQLNIDDYVLYIEVLNKTGSKTYYSIINKTSYTETVYYTITNNNSNKKITITSDEEDLYLKVVPNVDEVYDIVLDPGHGGKDEGACHNKVCETDYTLVLAELVKKDLEDLGYKVALTRTENVYLGKYGSDGRIARSYQTKAKLLISIHLNSTSVAYDGFEIYTSNNIDYSLARQIVTSIDSVNELGTSNNTGFCVEPGIYTRTFSSSNVNDINKEVETPYPNVSTNTNYYFMIRETGGYMSGAYVDEQNDDGENPYRNNNVGLESYILELGYINNPSNVDLISKYKADYMKALATSINTYFKG